MTSRLYSHRRLKEQRQQQRTGREAELQTFKLTPKHHQQENHQVQNLNDHVVLALIAGCLILALPFFLALLIAAVVLPIAQLEVLHEVGREDDAKRQIECKCKEFQKVELEVCSESRRQKVREAEHGVTGEEHAHEAAARDVVARGVVS